MTLGEKIQVLRKQKGLSQEQLADMLNLSRQAISKWETNESQPDIERLIGISNLFKVSIDFLIKDGHTSAPAPLHKPEQSTQHFIRTSRNSKIYFLVSAIYSLATIVFLLLGFIWGLWHPGWIIFFVPPVIVRLLQQVMSKDMEDFKAFEEAIENEDD